MSFRTGRLDRCTNIENSVRIKPSKGFRYFVGYKSSVEFISLGGVQLPRGVQSLVRFRVATQTDNVRVGDWNPREGLKVASQFSDPLLFFLSFFLSFTNGSSPFLTTDLTHVTFELQSSSAHHCVLCGSKVEHLILFAGFRSITILSFYSVSTQKQ